jgi:predicted nucleic acid-binding protein
MSLAVTLVLDACSVIAWARKEQGAQVVEALMLTTTDVYMHTANLCEVYYDFLRVEGLQTAESVVADLLSMGIKLVDTLDLTFLREMGFIKANYRVSFADCFAIALARQHGAFVVTSDRTEFEPIQQARVCQVKFIR